MSRGMCLVIFFSLSVAKASPTLLPLVGLLGSSYDACAVSNPAIGTVCKGGPIWIGVLPSVISHAGNNGGKTKYMLAPLSTEVSLPWNDGTPNYADSGVEAVSAMTDKSTVLGDTNTAILAAATAPGGGSYLAAKYCSDLVFAGYDDWYLPSKSEFAYIYCKSKASAHNASNPEEAPNCADYGGKSFAIDAGFPSGTAMYQTSTEFAASYKWTQQTNDGMQFRNAGGSMKNWANRLRCIRRF